MNELFVIGGMAAVTLLIRYPVMALVSRVQLPETLTRALRYVPIAVLTAIIVPSTVAPAGQSDFAQTNAYLWVGLIAALIAWRTRNLLLTIVAGMLIFFLWRAIFGG